MNDLNLLSFYKKHKNEKDNEMLECPYLKHNLQYIQLNYEKIDDIEDKYTEWVDYQVHTHGKQSNDAIYNI